MKKLILTAIFLGLISGISFSQTGGESFKVLDLVFTSTDLVFKSEQLEKKFVDLEIRETETEIKIALPGDILFDFDKSDVRPDAEETLSQVVTVINQYPGSDITVLGHTDSKGSDSYNMKLSDDRAKSVRSWLINDGKIDQERIIAKGLGETQPAAENQNPDGSDNPEGRQQNRRVEIVIEK